MKCVLVATYRLTEPFVFKYHLYKHCLSIFDYIASSWGLQTGTL